jgi:hypothetical protein
MGHAVVDDLYRLGACAVKRYLRWIQSNYWGDVEILQLRVSTRSGGAPEFRFSNRFDIFGFYRQL